MSEMLPPLHWPRIMEIQLATCSYFGLDGAEMSSDRRSRVVAWPRQMAMFLCRELTSNSLPAIGRMFGHRDHSTVIHAIRRVERRLQEDPEASIALVQICRAVARMANERVNESTALVGPQSGAV